MNNYLEVLKKTKYSPNFWCSDEYFEKAGVEIIETDKYIYAVKDGAGFLPALNKDTLEIEAGLSFYAGFSNSKYKIKELDYEFIYEATSFNELLGKKHHTTRKNIRKVEKTLGYLQPVSEVSYLDYQEFIINWINENEKNIFYDNEVMAMYLYSGNNKLAFVNPDSKKIYSVCMWDYNWKFTNFRYCFCLNNKGLSDYSRVHFYRWLAEKKEYPLLVNDGGALESEGLFFYKKRLQPMKINKIRSYE